MLTYLSLPFTTYLTQGAAFLNRHLKVLDVYLNKEKKKKQNALYDIRKRETYSIALYKYKLKKDRFLDPYIIFYYIMYIRTYVGEKEDLEIVYNNLLPGFLLNTQLFYKIY